MGVEIRETEEVEELVCYSGFWKKITKFINLEQCVL